MRCPLRASKTEFFNSLLSAPTSDLTSRTVLWSSVPRWCLLSSEPGLSPAGWVTHEDTPPAPYFHTFWLSLQPLWEIPTVG